MSLVLDCRPSLAGKVALVAGGMGGIGRATVAALLAHGVKVAFTHAEGHEKDSDVAQVLATHPERLSAHALDLRAHASIEQCVGAVMAKWGRIDILVNAAAVGTATVSAYAKDAARQDSAMFAINADGALKLCQVYLAAMRDVAGDAPLKLINISSVGGGVQAFPGFRLSDGMSKAAVAHLTRQLAAELVHSPIDVFALCPGATDTPMFQASTLNHLTSEERTAFEQRLPKHRLIAPDEIANLIIFLASGYSTPLHGAVIDASMGLGVRPGLISESH
jgi:NAD(P)-dependent dehydrogenase (short-subunit alcohol dehydrogenase family)